MMSECTHTGSTEDATDGHGTCEFHSHDDRAASEELGKQMWSEHCLPRIAPWHGASEGERAEHVVAG